MRWFRSNIRVGSRLALMALAVQFVLSFSHVHLSELGLGAAKAAATVTAGVAGAATPDKAGAPTQKSDGPSDPGCAICGLIPDPHAMATDVLSITQRGHTPPRY